MTRVRIQPYGASRSARIMAESLNALEGSTLGNVMRLKKEENSRYRPRETDVILNWGSSKQRFPEHHYINKPSAVALAANKLKTFQALSEEVRIPEYVTCMDAARTLVMDGHTVYCREKLSGNSGQGIVIANGTGDLVSAPLYTVKVDCDTEYRAHVKRNEEGEYEVFDFQQKKKRDGVTADGSIRNTDNGYVFCRGGVILPDDVAAQAVLSADVLGLDFCGVDVGYNSETGEATVFEVNTACGLEGTTLTKYTEMLNEMIIHRLTCQSVRIADAEV